MVKTLDKKEILKLQKRIKTIYENICHTSYGSDDCVQTILTRFVEGKSKHQLIRFAVMDYLSSKYKSNERHEFVNYDMMAEAIPSQENNKEKLLEIADQIKNDIDRAFFVLYYKWGLNLREVAECFNCHESIVSARLKRVREKLIKIHKEVYV
jgi:DNA-directed RNA polymerase specialized sigma subunit